MTKTTSTIELAAKVLSRSRGLKWFPALCLLVICGCSPGHYRRSADNEVYGIVQQVEKQIFGHTNEFTIDTAYSRRTPDEIPPSELIEERLDEDKIRLTIEDALRLAVEQSRRYQAAKEALYLTTLALTGQKYAFSPQFFATWTGTSERILEGSTSANSRARVGVGQLLKTGGQLSLNLANDLLRFQVGEDPRQSVISAISVNLAQPLLRGLGKNNPAVERLTQSERDVVYAVREFGFFQDEFALEIVNDYFGLLAQKDVIRNRYTNYLGRVQSTKRLEARSKDRESASDVDQVRQAELTAKNNYVNAVATYRNSLDDFKIKLGLNMADNIVLDDSALEELSQTGLVPAPLDPQVAYAVAVEHQLQILNAIDQFEDAKRKVSVAADQLRPGLDVVSDVSLASTEPADYTRFNADRVRAGVGLELDLPIDRLNERNDYRAALVAFEAELRAFTLTLDDLYESIKRGLRTLEQRRQNFLIQKNALALANRRVVSTTLLLEAGRAEVRDLVDAQDAQISAQNALTVALVDYQLTRLQLMLDIGALEADQPKFWLRDHLAGYLPPPPGDLPVPLGGDEDVLPPEAYFN